MNNVYFVASHVIFHVHSTVTVISSDIDSSYTDLIGVSYSESSVV